MVNDQVVSQQLHITVDRGAISLDEDDLDL